MTDPHRDFSCSTSSSISTTDIPLKIKNVDFESSLDSYKNLFDKNRHNFTTSSELSFVNIDGEQLDENPLSTPDHNRTFIKEVTRKIINAFTGKPISRNPWAKLCTKNVQQEKETNIIVPVQVFSSSNLINPDKTVPQGQFSNQIVTCQSPSMINNQRTMDNTNDEDDPAFEQILQEHQNPIEIPHHQNTSLQRRRKKRNSLKDFIDNSSSSSSDEDIQERPSNNYPKINRLIENDPSWHRLGDVYTSEESDENNLLQSNISYSIRLNSEIYKTNHSSCSTSPSTATKNNTKTYFNFLESLSARVPMEDKHPDAKSYFQSDFNIKEKRQELANKLLSIFNQDVFSSQLSDKVSVVWSGRLTTTAGHCTTRRNTKTAVITLSYKVCDSPERCRDTLLHEMCHAAVTLIDGVMEHGHGPLWRQWTRTVEQCYPYLPSISVRHTYDVIYKFIYRCVQCQYEVYRHSKSLNLVVDFCGKCMGKFELIINNNKDEINQERQTPKKTINKYNLYVKENFHTIKQANPHLSTPQLMKQLSQEYKQKNQQQVHIDLPDLDKLTI